MADYYIYSPFNGQAIALNCYCNRRTLIPCNTDDCPPADAPEPRGQKCARAIKTQTADNCANCSACYCGNCCSHTIVKAADGHCCPLDIVANEGAQVAAFMSASIGSVKILYAQGICRSVGGAINLGTFVELYTDANASGKSLGRLLYGHLANREQFVTDGQIVNKFTTGGPPWHVTLGNVPSKPVGQTCYQSFHTHFSGKGYSGVGFTRMIKGCNYTASVAASPIYKWTF